VSNRDDRYQKALEACPSWALGVIMTETRREADAELRAKVAELAAERDEMRRAYDSERIREGCLVSFLGGYSTPHDIEVFRHGMETVCNVLRAANERLAKAAPLPPGADGDERSEP
jgi:hypothetical protein